MAVPHPFHSMLCSSWIVYRRESDVRRRFDFRNGAEEERSIHTLEFCVVDDVGVQIDIESFEHALDVLDCDARVVRVVEMRSQHAKTEFLSRDMKHVRRITTTTDADDDVVFSGSTVLFNTVDCRLKNLASLAAGRIIPVEDFVLLAVIANTFG